MKTLRRIAAVSVVFALVMMVNTFLPVQQVYAAESSGGIARTILAATDLGGLNLNGYCHQKYYFKNLTTLRDGYAYLSSNSPYGWKCSVRTYFLDQTWSESFGMDLNGACRMQKGNGAYAGLTGNKGPYDWHCFR